MNSDPSIQIPALSVQQPWAELIVSGRKTIEIRTWDTSYRGMIWLHTGLKENRVLDEMFGYKELFRGGFLGSVFLEAIVAFDANRWELWRERHLDGGSFRPGFYGWILNSPYRFSTPLIGKGSLGLFNPLPEIYERLVELNFNNPEWNDSDAHE